MSSIIGGDAEVPNIFYFLLLILLMPEVYDVMVPWRYSVMVDMVLL